MQTYFEKMNESYIDKHYPERSVFSSINKSGQKNGIGVYVLLGAFALMTGAAMIWSIKNLMEFMKEGESDMMAPGLTIIGICFLLFAVSLFGIIITAKRNRAGVEGLIKKSAKNSGCSESDIREFERQAMASDSHILKLMGTAKAVLTGSKEGILTRDFIYLDNVKHIIMKRSDIIGALLVQRTYYISVGNSRKAVNYLTATLISNKGIDTLAEVTIEAGKALLDLLKEENSQIDVNDFNVMNEKEYTKYCKEKFSAYLN